MISIDLSTQKKAFKVYKKVMRKFFKGSIFETSRIIEKLNQ